MEQALDDLVIGGSERLGRTVSFVVPVVISQPPEVTASRSDSDPSKMTLLGPCSGPFLTRELPLLPRPFFTQSGAFRLALTIFAN